MLGVNDLAGRLQYTECGGAEQLTTSADIRIHWFAAINKLSIAQLW